MTDYPRSEKLYLVADAVVDALTSQAPRDRYVVGLDARLLLAMLTWLPTFAADVILRHVPFKLPTPKGCQTA